MKQYFGNMSIAYMDKLELSCTWNTANERSIKDTITIGTSDNRELKSDLDDLVSYDTCVQLLSPSSSSTPELKFNIKADLNISAIKIISEARIIELYGRCGEYLSTTHSDFVDDFEGMAVYSSFVKLNIPSSECSVKFNKLKHQDNFWLYGIGIYVEKCQDFKSASALVDFKSVSDRLKQSGCSLTVNAEQCMKLLQTFQKLARSDEKNSTQISYLDGHKTQNVMDEETSRKMCDFLLSMSPMLTGSKTLPDSSSLCPEDIKKLSICDSANVEIQVSISEQFKKLEDNLMVKVDERLKKIEQKLDLLMLLLQKRVLNVQAEQDVEK